ncbi:MAG: hypothetical protein Kow009_08120 [Spirochaetales bacterium]
MWITFLEDSKEKVKEFSQMFPYITVTNRDMGEENVLEREGFSKLDFVIAVVESQTRRNQSHPDRHTLQDVAHRDEVSHPATGNIWYLWEWPVLEKEHRILYRGSRVPLLREYFVLLL